MLAKPPVARFAELLDGETLGLCDLVDDGFLDGGEEDDGEGGKVLERVGECTDGRPGGLMVFEQTLIEA